MFDAIRAHQLDVMTFLCGSCGILVLLLLNTRFLSKSRKGILMMMELSALFLLYSDRAAYIYAGDTGHVGYIMVRLSNFLVFLLTPAVVFFFNMYLTDLLMATGEFFAQPKRLFVTGTMSAVGMVMAVVAAFTNLYYYFDAGNIYHRGSGFLLAYIIPVICPLIQLSVILSYRKHFSKLIFASLVLYIVVPICCGIIQIFTYGISIVNIAMVAVSISLYIFMYLDMNDTMDHAHEIEIRDMKDQQMRMLRLFDQTANAFVSAVEKKDEYIKGNSKRTAEYAKKIAEYAGKSYEDCEKVYYAALLHDVWHIGIPDDVIKSDLHTDNFAAEVMKQKPVIGEEILSCITEYPYLIQAAHYSHERYNGTGYPDGLRGEEIPEIARIIAVADVYVNLTTKKRYRDDLPSFVVRERFIRGSGDEFDPTYADIMVKIIDSQSNEDNKDSAEQIESEIECRDYRQRVTRGISVEADEKRITFNCEAIAGESDVYFSEPSIVLFDSFDGRIHNDEKSIEGYHYSEYGEIWFDAHSVSTDFRQISEREIPEDESERLAPGQYEIIAGRFEDHLKLTMRSADFSKEVVVALQSLSKAAYIGLTGENSRLFDIEVSPTGKTLLEDDIERIVNPVSYIDHLEADIKNVQVDRWLSDWTMGVEINGRMRLCFHTMSLPEAALIWHCPYIILYYSDDGQVRGPGYREYNLIKLNGEDQGDTEFAKNRFTMKRTPEFPGWEKWKEVNKAGMECEIRLEKRGDKVTLKTKNLGIAIEDVITITDNEQKVFVALSGDQVALTDIRVE